MRAHYAWTETEDVHEVGPMACSLAVRDDGTGVLCVNGQGHLPIGQAGVQELIARYRYVTGASER